MLYHLGTQKHEQTSERRGHTEAWLEGMRTLKQPQPKNYTHCALLRVQSLTVSSVDLAALKREVKRLGVLTDTLHNKCEDVESRTRRNNGLGLWGGSRWPVVGGIPPDKSHRSRQPGQQPRTIIASVIITVTVLTHCVLPGKDRGLKMNNLTTRTGGLHTFTVTWYSHPIRTNHTLMERMYTRLVCFSVRYRTCGTIQFSRTAKMHWTLRIFFPQLLLTQFTFDFFGIIFNLSFLSLYDALLRK